jgi:hypothetical protein
VSFFPFLAFRFWEMVCESLENDRIPAPDLVTFETVFTMLANAQEKSKSKGQYWRDSLSILALMPVNSSKVKFDRNSNHLLGLKNSISGSGGGGGVDDSKYTAEGSTPSHTENKKEDVLYYEVYRRFFKELERRSEEEEEEEIDSHTMDEEEEEIDWTSSDSMFDTPTVCVVSPEAPVAHNAVLRTLASAQQVGESV